MKITVIGHWGAFPGVGEATSGYLFQHGGYNLLIDCGSGVVSNIQHHIDLKDIDTVVLSHYHHDHCCDIGVLQYGRLISTKLGQLSKCLPIYGHGEDDYFNRLTMKPYTIGISYTEGDNLDIGPFNIEFLKTRHPVLCYAFKIRAGQKCVIYGADTSYFEELITFSRRADLCIFECNLYAGADGSSIGHMSSTDAARIAKMARAKELLLTHLPHHGNYNELLEDASKHYDGKISLASKGWIWE